MDEPTTDDQRVGRTAYDLCTTRCCRVVTHCIPRDTIPAGGGNPGSSQALVRPIFRGMGHIPRWIKLVALVSLVAEATAVAAVFWHSR